MLGVGSTGLKDRTLTNLYNALNVFRGKESIRIVPAAVSFVIALRLFNRERMLYGA